MKEGSALAIWWAEMGTDMDRCKSGVGGSNVEGGHRYK